MPRLLAIALLALLLLTACATPKEYTPPSKAVLQDPLPGKALLYLLRDPYDGASLSLNLGMNRSVNLPNGRYTAISLEPGTYRMSTTILGSQGPSDSIPPLSFEVGPNQRLCFFLPAPERRNVQSITLGPIPLIGRQMQDTGAARTWTAATPEDVNWFIAYTKPYVD